MGEFMRQVRREARAVYTDTAVIVTILGGAIFYAALYPQPYLNDIPRDVPIAVVDHDRSATSRQLIRCVDATPQVSVLSAETSIAAARDLVQSKSVHGFFVVERGFERSIARRESPVLAVAGDANYFLLDSNVVEGVVAAASVLGAKVRAERLELSGEPQAAAVRNYAPLRLEQIALFNSSMGYLSYVIPAVFVLILHQTLLLAAGLVGAARNEQLTDSVESPVSSPIVEMAARFLVLFGTYVVLSLLYFYVGFGEYGIEHSARFNDLALMVAAFVAATVSAGLALGALLPRRDLAAPIVMASSLPLVFTAGFVWPIEMIPKAVHTLSLAAPSTSAIQGFLKVNQMGAGFADVLDHWLVLLSIAIIYFTLAVMIRASQRHVP